MCSVTLLGTLRNFPFDTQVYTQKLHGLVVQLTREFGKTTAAKGTTTTINKMFNEPNHGSARALYFLVHFLTVLCKQQRE